MNTGEQNDETIEGKEEVEQAPSGAIVPEVETQVATGGQKTKGARERASGRRGEVGGSASGRADVANGSELVDPVVASAAAESDERAVPTAAAELVAALVEDVTATAVFSTTAETDAGFEEGSVVGTGQVFATSAETDSGFLTSRDHGVVPTSFDVMVVPMKTTSPSVSMRI